jgi:YfiH family protein
MVIIPKIFSAIPEIRAFHSTRIGGISSGNFSSLNLGLSTGDQPDLVMANRKMLFENQHLPSEKIATIKQIHSNKVINISEPGHHQEADGMITERNHLFLCVSSADCASVLLADKHGRGVAALHSGWRGTCQNIVSQALMQLKEKFAINPADILAFVGPCIGPRAFEVDEDVYSKFSADYFVKKENKWLFNMKEVIKDQLTSDGVPQHQIEVSAHCTFSEPEIFYSYRRDKGNTGRLWAVIGITG